MKKTIYLLSMIVFGINVFSAQLNKNGTANKSKATPVKAIEMPLNQPLKAADFSATPTSIRLLNNPVFRSTTALKNAKMKDFSSPEINFNNPNKLPNSNAISSMMKYKASTDTTFYESWESYNGVAIDWIPANWTELNKTGNAYTPGASWNPTWAVSDTIVYATAGNSVAFINYDQNGKAQDEWLISPAFTPLTADSLSFDMYYSPFWMYNDEAASTLAGKYIFDFTKPTATMQAYVSTDNGANWVKIWDANNYAAMYNKDNIGNYYHANWFTYHISMAAYIGKSVKLAFRYVGKNGDSMGLDNIAIRPLKPIAFYMRPQGYFYLGYTSAFLRSTYDLMLGHAYTGANWNNFSNRDAETFEWTFEDQKNPAATFTSTKIHPEVFYPIGSYTMPTLKSSVSNLNNSYKWGTATAGASFIAGGQSNVGFGTLGAGNYDLTSGITRSRFADMDYCFGTGPTKSVDAIANYFDTPAHKYILDSVWISLGDFAAPAGTQFKLIIRRIAKGALADTIATSICSTEDVKQYTLQSNLLYSMPFKNFVSIDPITGLDIANDYLEINDPIFVELSGFNIPDVTLAAISQITNTSNGESNAYVYYNYKRTDGTINRKLLGGDGYIGSTSLLFNLAATYSYLLADDSTFVAPIAGGNKTFNVTSYFSPDDWQAVELPSWLTAEQTFDPKTWALTYTLKAAALPADLAGRGATVKINSIGADMSINVTQGNYTGLAATQIANTKVINRNNSFDLSYTSDFNIVAIYNVAGQTVANYKLPANGHLLLPTTNLKKGIYLFRFIGKTTELVKVIF